MPNLLASSSSSELESPNGLFDFFLGFAPPLFYSLCKLFNYSIGDLLRFTKKSSLSLSSSNPKPVPEPTGFSASIESITAVGSNKGFDPPYCSATRSFFGFAFAPAV